MHKSVPWFAAAAAIVAADQAAKFAVQAGLAPGQSVRVTGFFDLVLAYNKGAAFSLLAAAPGWQTPLFIAVALAAVFVITLLLVRSTGRVPYRAGLALILGGALGNLVDRLQYGHVVDFLLLHAYGYAWPAFNVADSAITVGATLLVVEGFLHPERRAENGG